MLVLMALTTTEFQMMFRWGIRLSTCQAVSDRQPPVTFCHLLSLASLFIVLFGQKKELITAIQWF